MLKLKSWFNVLVHIPCLHFFRLISFNRDLIPPSRKLLKWPCEILVFFSPESIRFVLVTDVNNIECYFFCYSRPKKKRDKTNFETWFYLKIPSGQNCIRFLCFFLCWTTSFSTLGRILWTFEGTDNRYW